MVRLHVKRGDESQFLLETSVDSPVDEVVTNITIIYNGRLKISRLCMEIEELATHGTMLPSNMMGLTDEQIQELKLHDEWGDKCIPSGGWTFNKDEIGRRNGRQPNAKMQEVLRKTVEEAKAIVSKKQVQAEVCVNLKMVQEALDILRGAVSIVYPMGLPPHDCIRQEIENTEDLSGTQASLEVIELSMASLWFSGKEMQRSKKLSEYVGRNEKTRAVVKLQKMGQGAPGREPVMTEAEQKSWMMHAYRKQEEMKVGDSELSSSAGLPVSAQDTAFCRVEPKHTAPSLPSEADRPDTGSSEFISQELCSGNTTEPAHALRLVTSALANVVSHTDYSIFNVNR